MITGFPPSPFVERPVRNVLNLVGAALAFVAGILVVIGSTDTSRGNAGLVSAQVLAALLLIFGSIAVYADERLGVALIVGAGVDLLAAAIQYVTLFYKSGGPAVPTGVKFVIVSGIIALVAIGLSFQGLRTRGNPFVAVIGAVGGLLFLVVHVYPARHFPATSLMKSVAPFFVIALVMLITPFLGRVGALAALAASLQFFQQTAVLLRNGGGSDDLVRFGTPVAFLLILAGALILGLMADWSSQTRLAAAGANALYGYVPMPPTQQPAVAPNALWAPTIPGAPVFVGAATAAGTPDPWHPQGSDGSVSVLPTQVVQAGPAVVNIANPARWETDPYGRFEKRYWDGTRWTEHVSSKGSALIDPI